MRRLEANEHAMQTIARSECPWAATEFKTPTLHRGIPRPLSCAKSQSLFRDRHVGHKLRTRSPVPQPPAWHFHLVRRQRECSNVLVVGSTLSFCSATVYVCRAACACLARVSHHFLGVAASQAPSCRQSASRQAAGSVRASQNGSLEWCSTSPDRSY